MKKRFIAAVAIAAATVVPAQAAATVAVTLDVSLGDDRVDHARCGLTVPAGADGFDILDAAVAKGCIDSYESVDYGAYGRFLTCIDGICGVDAPTWALPVPVAYAGSTWNLTINDRFATVGLDAYAARAGDEVGLTYTAYLFAA